MLEADQEQLVVQSKVLVSLATPVQPSSQCR